MTICDSGGQPLLEVDDGSRRFDELNLVEADFSGKEVEGITFDSCNFVRADFTSTDLYGAAFYDVNCVGACFRGASLRGANLYQSNFASCDLSNADLNRDNMDGTAMLTDCNFQNANLVGTDLSGITHENTNFKGATYSHRTRFPEGFDPEAAGMIRVEDSQPVPLRRSCPIRSTATIPCLGAPCGRMDRCRSVKAARPPYL